MVTRNAFMNSPHNACGKSSRPAVILPCLPESAGPTEKDIHAAFIRVLREKAGRDKPARLEVGILTAIHAAADATDNSDAYVSRVLVDLGLMAPRLAFPGDFLDHVDACACNDRPLSPIARPMPAGYMALLAHWSAIGEDGHRSPNSTRTPGEAEPVYSFLNA